MDKHQKADLSKEKAKEIIEILEDKEYIFLKDEKRRMMIALINRCI